jgi:putative membrane protein
MRRLSMPVLILSGLTLIASGFIVNSAAAAETETGSSVSRLLNKANAMNYEEIQLAKLVRDKDGDNQAMMTFAKTLEGDHKANEDAVSALSREKNIALNGTPASIDQKYKRMKNLNGSKFNRAFLSDAVKDHSQALAFFKDSEAQFRHDPQVYRYIEETIPVLRAHLQIAQSLDHGVGQPTQQSRASKTTHSS